MVRSFCTTTALAATALVALSYAASPAKPATADVSSEQVAPTRTAVTFTVEDCEGCLIQLTSAVGTYEQADDGDVDIWTSRARRVRHGAVTFDVLARRTRGLSVKVEAPWEGQLAQGTTVAWRYNGADVGDEISLTEAVAKRRAAACWGGVQDDEVVVPLVVEQVDVHGVHGPVAGSIAFASTTQGWLRPMRRVTEGVLGSQDVNICH